MAEVNVSYVIPTRDRPTSLARTLGRIGSLPAHAAQVVVVDNASGSPAHVPPRLDNGITTRLIRLETNAGAAGRNRGAEAAGAGTDWLVMLDDDSHPRDTAFLDALKRAPGNVLAVGADIVLPRVGCREGGGLPEVFIGCGVAIRRGAFLDAGGYDPAFHYYAEEYDLSARLLLMGGRIRFEPAFGVEHHKVGAGRDMDLILRRLVRNNGWVARRYAPDDDVQSELDEIRARYRRIAQKENAMASYEQGLRELEATIGEQPRRAMSRALFDRFTGLAHAREAIAAAWQARRFTTAMIVEAGKNACVVERALRELGVRLVRDPDTAEALVIGTMSPGPMLDAMDRLSPGPDGDRVIAPWDASGSRVSSESRLRPSRPAA